MDLTGYYLPGIPVGPPSTVPGVYGGAPLVQQQYAYAQQPIRQASLFIYG